MFSRIHPFPFVVGLMLLTGCAGLASPGQEGPAVPGQGYRVGDLWVYRVADGFRLPITWVETHEVVAVNGTRVTVRVTQKGDSIDTIRTELWVAPGQVAAGALYDNETRRFAMPLQRYNFPLTTGQTWNQWVDNVNDTAKTEGAINRYVRVGRWDKVTTPAGTFDAIQLRVQMRLDDDEFWRWPTTCNYLVWYAPAVRAVVREERDAGYIDKGGPDASNVWTQHAVLELTKFTPGA